ncbi:lipase/acyltransferase domain-containing protein [Streptomyces cellulosae]|uniref:Lecithin:cholesterol acyltransferase n=1 Tax=Streptomyces cellulosae TaxID=1968 RepID=A0ABW7Y5H3_STRCE
MARDLTHDAVVVVPGIMGSALLETTTGRPLWGLENPQWLQRAWSPRGEGMRPLHLDDEERCGRYGRIEATGLLRVAAWAPFLQGFEPYGDLLKTTQGTVTDPAAVLEFAYDWRLPVAYNGQLLAEAAHRHLVAWRDSDAHQQARRSHPDEREARLVFVAHSMGGLVTRAALAHAAAQGSDLTGDVRAVVTLGTPFLGAVKAAVILGGSRSDPLPAVPRRRMQALAATLPGLHDLLPDYRCVDAGLDVHRLTPADVAALGGDEELAARTQDFQQRMRDPRTPVLPGHRAVVGIAQPTAQSLRLDGGVVREQYTAFERNSDGDLARDPDTGIPTRRNRAGDGAVYRDAAALPHTGEVTWLPLQHGALAKDSVALQFVRAVLTDHDHDLGPALGTGNIGLDMPDSADAGQTWTLRLLPSPGETLDTHAGIACTLHDADTDQRISTPRLGWYDDAIAARIALPRPGLYRVRVDTGSNAPLTQLILATDPLHDD